MTFPLPTAPQPAPPPHGRLRRAWDKYGLIVVGNIIFFVLLYWFSYRPHNAESRAGEILSIGQMHESDGQLEAALAVYGRIAQDYPQTRAARAADSRAQQARAILAAHEQADHGPLATAEVQELLEGDPTLLVAQKLAARLPRIPAVDQPRYWDKLKSCLGAVAASGTATPKALRQDPAFAGQDFARRLFDLQARCEMHADWYYDDFLVRNENFYPWTGCIIAVKLAQGGEKAEASLRLERLAAGQAVRLLEFSARRDGGPVSCTLRVETQEGVFELETRL